MTRDHLKQIVDIENRTCEFPWSEQNFESCINNHYDNFIMRLNDQLIGYFLSQRIINEFHLLNICIDKHVQGKGYGKQLFQAWLDLAKEHQAESVYLETRKSNVIAIQLYHSKGFEAVGLRKEYYPRYSKREDAIIFKKNLEIA